MPYPMTPEERNLSKIMMTAWTNFAKTGYANIFFMERQAGVRQMASIEIYQEQAILIVSLGQVQFYNC